MYLKVIACEVLARAVYAAAATSPHVVDVELVPKGLHETPAALRAELQRRVQLADAEAYDAIALAYGLCGNATQGLVAGTKRLIVVRAHDCITLYLGSRRRYQEESVAHPGTYYYCDDYVERSQLSTGGTFTALGAGSDADRLQETYQEYVRLYGEDNARYLMEVMGAWQRHYSRAAYIDMGIAPPGACRELALDEATRRGWTFVDLKGDDCLIRRLVHGEWDADLLVLEPGQRLLGTYDDSVMAGEEAPLA